MTCFAGLLVAAVLIGGGALAQDAVDSVLWLRIETGVHTATSTDAATDAGATVVVTASLDKTARIWSLPDLRPLGVLRPPIGPDHQGRIDSVAVSPDARLAAVGGWMLNNDVLIFDLQTHQVVSRLAGLPRVITALAFSLDGKRLAAGHGGTEGIRIWRVSDGALLAKDQDYGDSVFGLAFAPDGRVAAASWDGALRLYDPVGKRLQHIQTELGRRPYRIRFDPSGRLLAVGFMDALAVEVRDGTNLALRTRPDVSGLQGTSLFAVGWSADGATLYAGGNPWVGDNRPVFAWTKTGGGTRSVATKGFDDDVATILPLREGRLVSISGSGDIAVAGPDGKRLVERRKGAGDLWTNYTDPTRRLPLSRDGAEVAWVFSNAPNRWLHFDADHDELTVSTSPPADLTDWTTQAGGLRMSDWQDRSDPKLNGKTLTRKRNWAERVYSAAVASNRVLLGTDSSLCLFDADGQTLWSTPVTTSARRVNQSPDGRLAVAALTDGTIRWYRMSDGRELLALFVTPDAERWIAFTPSGYYTASPGGEDLIGWQVNNGRDRAADFFPASRYRDRFYRPELIARVLKAPDEFGAEDQANLQGRSSAIQYAVDMMRKAAGMLRTPQALTQEVLQDRPPVVTILSPRDGTQLDGDIAVLESEVRSPTGQAITRVELRLDTRPAVGAQIGAAQLLTGAPGEVTERRRITVPILAGQEVTLQVIAWSNDRPSAPATLRVQGRSPPAAPVVVAKLEKPRLNAVLIGVSAYQAQELRLKFAAKDAEDLAAALQRQGGPNGLYREVNIRILKDGRATREAILREIVWLQRETTQRDLAVLFLAGHGISEDVEYYFLTVDADQDSASFKGLSGNDLKRSLRQVPGRTIALLDTCYAGAMIGSGTGFRSPPPDLNKLINELSATEAGVAVYSATTGRQRAQERDELHNGVFTRALLDALEGRIGQTNSVLRLNTLAVLLAEDVKSLTNGKQASTYNALAPLADVPLFLVRQ